MARTLGPDPSTKTVIQYTRDFTLQAYPGRNITFYTDEALTAPADVAAYQPGSPSTPGAALPGSRVTLDEHSQIPNVWFPDGVTVLWGKVHRGPTVKVTALDVANVATAAAVDLADLRSRYRTDRPQTRVNDTMVTMFQSGHTFAKNGAPGTVNLNDTSDFCLGTQSLSMVSAAGGTGQTISVRNTAATGIDLTGRQLRIWVKVTNRAALNSLAIFAFSGSTSNSYSWTWDHGTDLFPLGMENCWVPITLNFANAGTSGTPSRSNITQWQFNMSDNGTGVVTVRLNGLGHFADASTLYPNGVIIISFDDGWDTQYLNAGPVLAARGLKASFHIIADRIGTAGYMTLGQLYDLKNKQGHEISAHAYTLANHNLNFQNLFVQQGEQALADELANVKDWLIDKGFADGSDIMVLPNGAYGVDPNNGPSAFTVAQRYFAYVRTIYAHQGQYVETIPPADPTKLRAISGISGFAGGISAATVASYVTKVRNNACLGTLVFHRITSGAATSTNECSLADFTTIIDNVIASGVTVLTMGDVMRSVDTSRVSRDYLSTALAGVSGGTFGTATPASSSGTAAGPGVATTYSRSDHVHPLAIQNPQDHGLISWAYDPAVTLNTTVLASGTMTLVRLHNPVTQNISNVWSQVTTVGSGLTAMYVGLYQASTNNLLSQQSDAAATLTAFTVGNNTKQTALTTTSIPSGDIYVAFLPVGTTGPTILRAAGNSLLNLNLVSTAPRFGTAGSGLTTLPGTLPTINALSNSPWAAIS